MNEAGIEAATRRRALREHGVESVKMSPQGSVGWPDRLFLIPGGRPLFIEFKRPGGKLRPMQEYRIALLRGLGYRVEVCDTVADALAAVQEALCLNPCQHPGRRARSRKKR